MRQNAKEVKVIHRWRADEFDGEIPIDGDEEMLGTAMKVANQVGDIKDSVEQMGEIAAPYFKGGVWLNAHILAPLAVTNGAYNLGALAVGTANPAKYSWKVEAGKVGFGLGSVIANVYFNGKYIGIGNKFRGVTTMVGSGILGGHIAAKKLGLNNRLSSELTKTSATGMLVIAGASYAINRFIGGP